MKDIHEVLRRKQARYAQLSKQIEMLQQAAEKLREVAPLLAEIEDDDAAVLADVDEQPSTAAKRCGGVLRALRLPLPSRLAAWLRAGLNPRGFYSPHHERI